MREEVLRALEAYDAHMKEHGDKIVVRCTFDISLFGESHIQGGKVSEIEVQEDKFASVGDLLNCMKDCSTEAAQGVLLTLRDHMHEEGEEEEDDGLHE